MIDSDDDNADETYDAGTQSSGHKTGNLQELEKLETSPNKVTLKELVGKKKRLPDTSPISPSATRVNQETSWVAHSGSRMLQTPHTSILQFNMSRMH